MTNDTKTKRPSFTQVMTPKGTLIWPKLDEPDEYKGKKSYSAKIRLSAEDSEALIAKMEAELKAYWPTAVAEYEQKIAEAKTGADKAKAKKALADMKEADKTYKPAYDEEGNETGEYEFNFKMPDHFMGRDKKPVFIRPDVFDAAGKKLTVVPEIWGGSEAYVAGEMRPFSMPIGVGVSLRLKAVQIITMAAKGGGSRDAAGYGFGKEEGGYEADDSDEAAGAGFPRSEGDSGSTGEPEHF